MRNSAPQHTRSKRAKKWDLSFHCSLEIPGSPDILVGVDGLPRKDDLHPVEGLGKGAVRRRKLLSEGLAARLKNHAEKKCGQQAQD